MVGVRGLEPPTSASQTLRASQLRHTPSLIVYASRTGRSTFRNQHVAFTPPFYACPAPRIRARRTRRSPSTNSDDGISCQAGRTRTRDGHLLSPQGAPASIGAHPCLPVLTLRHFRVGRPPWNRLHAPAATRAWTDDTRSSRPGGKPFWRSSKVTVLLPVAKLMLKV